MTRSSRITRRLRQTYLPVMQISFSLRGCVASSANQGILRDHGQYGEELRSGRCEGQGQGLCSSPTTFLFVPNEGHNVLGV